jgi:hypothetical protein
MGYGMSWADAQCLDGGFGSGDALRRKGGGAATEPRNRQLAVWYSAVGHRGGNRRFQGAGSPC